MGRELFAEYNTQHDYSGIAYPTPKQVDYAYGEQVLQREQGVVDRVYRRHLERCM